MRLLYKYHIGSFVNLRVPEELKLEVRALAARENVDMSDIIIEAIKLYQEKHGKARILTEEVR